MMDMSMPNKKRMPQILIAEDDAISRLILRSILTKEERFEIVEARNGAEAWDLLNAGCAPDLCVTDIMMPIMDGMQLLEKIRADPRFRTLKVILCTCMSDRSTVFSAARLGVRHYIVKPFAAAKVLASVKEELAETAALSFDKWQNLAQRLGANPHECIQVIRLLAKEIGPTVAAVREEISRGNLTAAQCLINSLKGASLNLGDEELAEMTSRMEYALDAGKATSTEDLDCLEKQSERLCRIADVLEKSAGPKDVKS
jgi:two-component system, chemotaxis family, chemotaxis protein CheY